MKMPAHANFMDSTPTSHEPNVCVWAANAGKVVKITIGKLTAGQPVSPSCFESRGSSGVPPEQQGARSRRRRDHTGIRGDADAPKSGNRDVNKPVAEVIGTPLQTGF